MERFRAPFNFYQRTPRFIGDPRMNPTQTPRRALPITPPAAPSRFPMPHGIEMQHGAFQNDPFHFNLGPRSTAHLLPPHRPFPPGAEMTRPRFPLPRNPHPHPGTPAVQPLPPHGPKFRSHQLPSSSNEVMHPQFQQPLPGFRAPCPPRSVHRSELHRPGFSPREFRPSNVRPEERFRIQRPNFAPHNSFEMVQQNSQSPGFSHLRLNVPERIEEPGMEHYRLEYDAGSFELQGQSCGTWNAEDAHMRQQFNKAVPNQVGYEMNFLPSPGAGQHLKDFGEDDINHHGQIQMHENIQREFRTEQNYDWSDDNKAKITTDYKCSETEVERFQHSDCSRFGQQQLTSGTNAVWGETSEGGGKFPQDTGFRNYKVRKESEAEERRRGFKRSGSHLDESRGKQRKSFNEESNKDRSLSDRKQRTPGSPSGKSRDRQVVHRSQNQGSRNRRSSELSSRSEKSLHRRFVDESSCTSEKYEESGKKVFVSSERPHHQSRRSRENVGRSTSSRLSRTSSCSTKNTAPREESRRSSRPRRSLRHGERSLDESPESSESFRPSRRHQPSRSPTRQKNYSNSPAEDVKPCDVGQSEVQEEEEEEEEEAFGKQNQNVEKRKENEGEEEVEEERIPDWIRCSPADLYFKRDRMTGTLVSTNRMQELEKKIEYELLCRAERVKEGRPQVKLPLRQPQETEDQLSDDDIGSNVSFSEIEDLVGGDEDNEIGKDEVKKTKETEEQDSVWLEELNWKRNHPERLHDELWFNLPGEMNDGPLCRCCGKARSQGIRHNIYPGEEPIPKCDPHTNNQDQLFHYRITMSPHTNFLTKNPTLIEYDSHEYIFEGFSVFSHYRIGKIPLCKVIRFSIEYTIHWFEEEMIENFDVQSLDLFADFLYREILELVDLDWAGKTQADHCRPFHIMPRFARDLPDNGKEILSMNEVLNYLWRSCRPLMEETELANMLTLEENEWQNVVDEVRGMIVTYPGMRPSSLRIDQLDREQKDPNVITYPKIIHFGLRPAQLSYAGDPKYKKLWKHYMKLKHLIANKPKASPNDKEKMRTIEDQLQEIRLKGSMKREMTVEISSEGFIRTGIKSDICQHALLLPVLVQHLRFHRCLDVLEKNIKYQFKDRLYLELAMTHPSYRTNYGTNPDHARNSLTNCGFRQLEYGDRQIHYINRRKRGINVLMHIMSKLAKDQETLSEIHHYERLEFLGDSVIEFLSSIHLFFMFPRLEEGGLATYRAALVQNQFLTVLAEKIGLHHFMLYAHGPDLCLDLDLRYAMANCFEALMGSLFLDGGVEVVDKVYGEALFKDEPELLHVWSNLPRHPLQEDEPNGDRHWIPLSQPLQKLMEFEKMTGIVFNHIRLLARAFTMRNIGYNNLTLGHNQTLEFLGDTVLQFISSEYLFKHFPDHHEGHLTLLRTSLVNHRTQATICDDLGMTEYVINNDKKVRERMENEKNKVKDKADILEAFLGALYVDQGLEACKVLTEVCFYPRLREFIMNQDWNDAKSQLQQCCLTLRDPSDGDPDIPVYKVLQCTGPTNTRKYHVAVYFRGERLGTGIGHSIQRAEMNAAANALTEKQDMFPHLLHVQHFLDRRFGKRRKKMRDQPKNLPPHHHHRHHRSSLSEQRGHSPSQSRHRHHRFIKRVPFSYAPASKRSTSQHRKHRSATDESAK